MTMTKEQIGRCMMLAEHLETSVSREEFNMANWGVTSKCGTVCCAAGHAALMPEIQRQGLSLKLGRYGSGVLDFKVGPRTHSGWSAVYECFGTIIPFDSRYYPSNDPTPQEVAAKIRECVGFEQH